MTIDVHFESYEEFMRYMGTCCAPARPVEVWPDESGSAHAEAQEENESKVEAPAAVPAEEEKPKPTEDLRVEARKILADLNKRTGKNTAKELLTELGYASLNKVPLEKLQEVIDRAREEDTDAE